MIKTERLNIHIASKEEMEDFIFLQTNDILRIAYQEMLDNALKNQDKWEWYAMWMIELKNGIHIGELCFKGLDTDGITEIGYGISSEYQMQGYATEAVKAVTEWAIKQSIVIKIEAETEDDNTASKRVLEKCGFIATNEYGEEGPGFVLLK